MSAKWSDDTKFPVVSSLDYFMGLVGGANAKCSRSDLKSSLSLVKGDVGLGNVDNTSDANKNAASVTLVNKTISGASNTLSNIGNASLTNSAITIAGTSVSLGGSISLADIVGGTLGTAAFTDAATYMAVSTYDPMGQSRISGASPGGVLNLDGGNGVVQGGSILANAGSGTSPGAGGTLDLRGGTDVGVGGQPGGSIDTHDGGGSLDTRGTGSLELGIAATRTTLVGAATAARTITLPDATGTLLYGSGPLGTPASGDVTACAGRLFGIGMALSGEAAVTTGDKGAETVGIACKIVSIYLNCVAAPTGSNLIVDIKKNGTTIFSTKISIDTTETNSSTAAVPYVLSSSPTTFTVGDVISYHVDQLDSGATATFLVCDILLETN